MLSSRKQETNGFELNNAIKYDMLIENWFSVYASHTQIGLWYSPKK